MCMQLYQLTIASVTLVKRYCTFPYSCIGLVSNTNTSTSTLELSMALTTEISLEGLRFVCKQNKTLSGKRIFVYNSVTTFLCQKSSVHEGASQKHPSKFCILRNRAALLFPTHQTPFWVLIMLCTLSLASSQI